MKKSILFIITLIILFSFTACGKNNKTEQLEQQVSELQSQVTNLEEQVNPKPKEPEPIPEEDIPDVDLMELAKKIVEECPPPEGVELVFDTENVESMFNQDAKHEDSFIDINVIDSAIQVYNPNPNNNIYYFLIAKSKKGLEKKQTNCIAWSAEDTMNVFFKDNIINNEDRIIYPVFNSGKKNNYHYCMSVSNVLITEDEAYLMKEDYNKTVENIIINEVESK